MRIPLVTIVAMAALLLPVRSQTPPPSDTDLAQEVVRAIAEAKGDSTPAQWLQTHAGEKLQLFNGAQYANDTQRWCARTVLPQPSSAGHAWTRSVYFYDPPPPADDALPAQGASSEEILEANCHLGLMWIDIPEVNPTIGIKLTEELQAVIVSRYGPGSISPFGPGGFGSAGWTSTRQWNVHGGLLTVAYDQFRGKSHRVLVRLAFANSDAMHDLVKETEQARIDRLARRDKLIGKVKEAGMASSVTAEMAALLEKPDYFSGQKRPSETEIVAALRDWLTAAKSQSPDKRAIALLAADRVVDFLGHDGFLVREAARAELKSLGADYVHDELAGTDVYAHGLVKEAKTLAPPGPSADELLLFEMERGFDETGMCGAGAEEFSQVIEQGEALLGGGRALPSSTRASLHFMIGDAYTTIVWLAKTTDTEYHDPTKYRPMAESARTKALEHYRSAFTLERGTARAQKAWKEAWRLAAGLTPAHGRYFCVYD